MMSMIALFAVVGSFLGGDTTGRTSNEQMVESLIANERAFSVCSVTSGTDSSFLAYIDDDGVLLRPRPVKGKPWLQGHHRTSNSELSWAPAWVIVAASGDLGFTFGPWEWREHRDSPAPSAAGEFVTAWKRQVSGEWKFVFDTGIDYAGAAEKPVRVDRLQPLWHQGTTVAADTSDEIFRTIDGPGIESRSDSSDVLDPDVVLQRQGLHSIRGMQAVKTYLSSQRTPSLRHLENAMVARAGDLAYSYGLVRRNGVGSAVVESCYFTIWRRSENGGWRILLDNEGEEIR